MSYVILNHRSQLQQLPMHEVYRYMGAKSTVEELINLVDDILPQFMKLIDCRACYMELPVCIIGDYVDLDVITVNSTHLAKNLNGCSRVILFAATIGAAVDRQRYIASVSSPTKALVLDAMGSAAIESFCDQLCQLFEKEYPDYRLHPRFSPGYGDLSIGLQSDFLSVLDTQRRIGLMLSESLMMLPQKSVTAIVGLEKSDIR